MNSLLGRAAFRSSGTLEVGSYEDVAPEYYNARLHPTCADFRAASRLFLEKLFREQNPRGWVADIGCGRSLVSEFVSDHLVLVDASPRMLAQNVGVAEKRLVDLEKSSFAQSEFDWIFAVLADPFNSKAAWANISSALNHGGRCVFIVPSYQWVSKFRSRVEEEKAGFARFVREDNAPIFLPSTVYPPQQQAALIESVGMRVTSFQQVFARELQQISSPKISRILAPDDALLDVYCAVNS
jgi:SAM-dependent methyltransferase